MNTLTLSTRVPASSLHDAPLARLDAATPTPVRLLQFAAGLALAVCLLAAALRTTGSGLQEALRVTGRDCAPSIVAAWRVRVALASLDASLVDQFLTAAHPRDLELARRDMIRLRSELGALLVEAAGNATFGAAEKEPLTSLIANLAQYEAEMMRAQTFERLGQRDGAREAASLGQNLLRGPMRQAVEALERVNREQFELAHRRALKVDFDQRCVLVGLLLVGAGGLLAAQIFLQRRTRRLLNPGLLGASLVWLLAAGLALSLQSRATEALREAKDDAFASIATLWQTRALAAEANRLESRGVFDPSVAAVAEAEVDSCLGQILLRSNARSWRLVAADLDAPSLPTDLGGSLVAALRNVTYPDERTALLRAARALADYAEIDAQIRRLAAKGQRDEAVRLCLSHEVGGSNGAYQRLTEALERALEVNQTQFDAALARGTSAAQALQTLGRWQAVLLLGLVLAGLWPRWIEYRR